MTKRSVVPVPRVTAGSLFNRTAPLYPSFDRTRLSTASWWLQLSGEQDTARAEPLLIVVSNSHR